MTKRNERVARLVIGLALLLHGPIACGGPAAEEAAIIERIADLRVKQQEHEVRLGKLKSEIEESEAQARKAEVRALIGGCRARRAAINAEVSFEVARCMGEIAAHQQCRASNSEKKAKGTMTGVILGVAAAAMTGGASALYAVGGAGAGGKLVGTKQCPAPACEQAEPVVRQVVLKDRGLDVVPRCGGVLGVKLDGSNTWKAPGVLVKSVGPGTTALVAGIRPGDVLTRVARKAIRKAGDVSPAVADSTQGAEIKVRFIRDGVEMLGAGTLGRRGARGFMSARPALGVVLGKPTRVAIKHNARVGEVETDSPADRAGLRAGDGVTFLDGKRVRTPADFWEALDPHDPGTEVRLTHRRDKKNHKVVVTLAERFKAQER